MQLVVEPIGFISCTRLDATDDDWDAEASSIQLVQDFDADALKGLEDFSHLEVLYQFHQVDAAHVMRGARHPRGNQAWPRVGIFAQRAKGRPNRLGTTICRLLRIEGTTLRVAGLDAIHGTPVLDLKPVMDEFLPREPIAQPQWSRELMREYWSAASPGCQLEAISPVLAVADIDSALAFYGEGLGFTLGWKSGQPATHANVRRDRVDISLTLSSAPANPGNVYVRVAAVDEYRAELLRRKVAAGDLGNRDYGMRDFLVIDPFGNRLVFGQPTSGLSRRSLNRI